MFYPEKPVRTYTAEQEARRSVPYKARFPNLHDEPDYSKVEEELATSQVILIRHANSLSNNLSERMMETIGEYLTFGQWVESQSQAAMIDCKLSEKGIEQCLRASEHAIKINFVEI